MFAGVDTAEVSLDLPCRTVCAVRADPNESQFLVGSCSTSETNTVHVLHYNNNNNNNDEVNVRAQLVHEHGPMEVICSSPKDPTFLCTAHSSSQLLLHQLPDEVILTSHASDDRMDNTSTMEQLMTMETNGIVSDMSWGDESSTGELLFITRSGHVTQFDIETQQSIRTLSLESSSTSSLFHRLQWDPHANGHAVAVTAGKRVWIQDWRTDTSIPTGTVDVFVAHRRPGHVTALDYNPNKPYVLATGGQDGLVQFWDLRLTNRPLLVARGGHSHWISSVQYNPFHDQLVLSSGTDSVANLWRMSTISSAPLLTMMSDADGVNPDLHDDDDDASETAGPNARIARHEHVDAIYSSCWSAADAWVYLTLGYDGKVQCHSVPSKEKYKILL